MVDRTKDAIAIVGIGCVVPGADNIRDFWRVLLQGENHVNEVPPSRWNADAFYDPDPMTPGKAYVKRAGLVNEPDAFDNKVYGINDFEAAQMDPQQRFVLDCTLMALQDAGLTRAQLAGSDTGVFLGVSNTDYRVMFRATTSGLNNYTVTGISNSIIAARVSYVFDLRGPSLVLDTACSSSLIGMHLACQAIRAGDCKMAIAGGTNFLTLPDVFVHLCKAGMMSQIGQCHAFGSKADGYVRGEGCGVVILKPLCDAERDGDKIWATIYTGSNQDGHTVSPLTAPSGLQQECLLDSVSRKMELDLDRIDYIEAHGTGTSAGDPVEANAVGKFFLDRSSDRQRYMGSVKTNIGHLESAAGVVGIIKILLMMKHDVIVPSLHCEEANPQINFPELRLTVPGKPVNWDSPNKVACCNSFGFGGSNSHAVLCQYQKREQENQTSIVPLKADGSGQPCVVALSACTEKSLRGIMEEVVGDPELHMLHVHDLSYTSTVRRDHYPVRVAHVIDNIQDLADALEEDMTRPLVGAAVYKQPKVTYVFGGMGTSWPGMCTQLMDHVPVFRYTILQVEDELKKYVDWSLTKRLQDEHDFEDPLFSPIAIFACQVALAAVWRDLGLEPQSIVGQSVGEVGAAHVAGCLTLGEAVKVIYHRSRLLTTVTGGKMVIVRNVPVENTRQVVTKFGDKASISLFYSPTACCISVNQDTLHELRADLTTTLREEHKGLQMTELHVPVAYHSPHVDPCKALLAAELQDLQAQAPTVPLVSSVTGTTLTKAPDVDYWVANLHQPVLFDRAVMKSRDSNSRQLFVEIGPKPVLRAHLSDIFPKADVTCVASMSKPPEFKVFLEAVAAVYESGADILWNRLPSLGTRITDIPRYVFDKKKNLLQSESAVLWLSGVDELRANHPFLFPLNNSADFKLIVGSLALRSVYDHIVSGRVLVPGAVYAEAGLAIGQYLTSFRGRRWAVSVDFEQAATVPKDSFLDLDVHVDDCNNQSAGHVVPITVLKDKRVLAQIRISQLVSDQPTLELVNVEHVRAQCPDKVSKDTIYSSLWNAGFMYGEAFTQLEDAYASNNECICTLKLHPKVLEECPGTTIHPAVVDCMLQSSLLIAGGNSASSSKELLPKALGRLVVHRHVDPIMLIHTRLKSLGVKQQIYDLTLLTLSGAVIAELDGLVINLITEAAEHSIDHMYVTTWNHVTSLPSPGGDLEEDKKVVFFTDLLMDEGPDLGDKVKLVFLQGMDFTQGMPASVQQVVTSNRNADALVLLCLEPFSDSADADAITVRMLNLSFLYKEVITLANRLSLSAPLYLCTCNAWPSPLVGHDDLPVNPSATGLWGLGRTVLSERIYPDTRTVELQLPADTLTASFLHTLFSTLVTHPDVQHHAELLVNWEGVYGNLISPVDPSTSVPMFRTNRLGHNEDALLLSKETSAVVTPHAVLHDVNSTPAGRDSPEMLHIHAQTYALQNASLLKLKMPYERLDQNHASKTSGFPLLAIEVIGNTQMSTTWNDKSQKPLNQRKNQMGGTGSATNQLGETPKPNKVKTRQENGKIRKQHGEVLNQPVTGEGDRVVACYPVAMGTKVTVPRSVTIPASLLPGCQPGDLTKLLLLFELHRKVQTPRLTVLASKSTRPYAEVLREFFSDRRHSSKVPYTVNIIMADQLHTQKTSLDETVISLVLLDGRLTDSLIAMWNKAKALITCASFLQSEAYSCLSCFADEVDLVLVDTQLLFHPISLKSLVPRVGQWLREKGAGVVSNITACLHQEVLPTLPTQGDDHETKAVVDLSDLLHFRTSEITNLKVQVSSDQLFRQDSVYLVVGGLSGLGWLCVEYLAENNAGNIAILNRRRPSPEQVNKMTALSSRYNCHVMAFQGDVTSLHSLTTVLKQMETEFPATGLKGIFFGAAVTADKSFLAMDVPGFESALSPKVRGTWNLHTLTQNMPLDYFVMHSSIASIVGNAGQANYAAGNAFMDGLAHYRRRLGLAAQSINWGVLDLGILSVNEMAREMLESRGFLLMSAQEIRTALTPMLMLNWAQSIPLKLDRERLSQRMYREASDRIITRMKPILTESVQAVEEDLLHVVHTAKNCSPTERLAIYEQYLQILVSRVLSVELSSVTLEVNLLELGMDSVGAMTLVTQIHRDTSKRLNVVHLLTGEPTVVSLAEAINEAPEGGAVEEDETPGNPDLSEENKLEDSSSEALFMEHHQLKLYTNHTHPEHLHIVVDIPLQSTQADLNQIRTALTPVLTLYPSACTTFTQVTGSSKVAFRRSQHSPEDSNLDLRVIEDDGFSMWQSLDAHSCEELDLQQRGPVRFLLMQHTARPTLRVVLHKVAFDLPSATLFAEDVRICLESHGSVPDGFVSRELDLVTRKLQSKQVQNDLRGDTGMQNSDYWTRKLTEDFLVSTSLSWDSRGHSMTVTDSVNATVAPYVVKRLKAFMIHHKVTLLGIVASCYQMVLRALTKERTIPLLFHLDLRKYHGDITMEATNRGSDLPLLADFGAGRATRSAMSLQSFVLLNNENILKDILHGEIPLSLMESLSEPLSTALASTQHGIAIEQLKNSELNSTSNTSADVLASSKKVEQALRFTASNDAVAFPLNLETNLIVRHRLHQDAMTMTLTFKKSVFDPEKGRVLLGELLYVMLCLVSQSATSLDKISRRGAKLKQHLEKLSKKAGGS